MWLWPWLCWLDRVSCFDTYIRSGVTLRHIYWTRCHISTHILDRVSRSDILTVWVWVPCHWYWGIVYFSLNDIWLMDPIYVCLLCGNYLFISCLLELTVNDHAQSVCYLVSGDQGSRHFLERMFVFLNNEKWCSVHDAQVHRSYLGKGIHIWNG